MEAVELESAKDGNVLGGHSEAFKNLQEDTVRDSKAMEQQQSSLLISW